MNRDTIGQGGWRAGACLLAGMAVLGGCVSREDLEVVHRDVVALRQEVASLSKANEGARAFTEERLGRLETEVRGRFDSAVKESEGSRAALASRLDELATETRLVQGKLEENAFILGNLNTRLDALDQQSRVMGRKVDGLDQQVKRVDQQVRALDQQVRGVSPPAPVGPAPGQVPGQAPGAPPLPGQPTVGLPAETPPATVQPPVVSPGGPPTLPPPAAPTKAAPAPSPAPRPLQQVMLPPEEVYKNALGDYTKGNYDLAIAGFRTYLQHYSKSSLAPNAQYWLAEAYYSQKNYAQAIEEFDVVIRDFPENPKVPSALFKQGDAYLQMGDSKQANIVLCELVSKYAKTREARLARERNLRCR